MRRFKDQAYYDQEDNSRLDDVLCDPEEDKTIQSAAGEADINELVRRFGITGEIPRPVQLPEFLDLSDAPQDFGELMSLVRRGQEAFDGLSPEIRERFGNDPARFWAYLETSENIDEAIDLGLLTEAARIVAGGDSGSGSGSDTGSSSDAA